eukprot:CAMPEP_0119472904 /NCGR_PEP_ID=MMETSP1344-20130328/4778_1 /TAXON_ID=236787 /ORGANISM="Florenciella parvula, Strain CCMP2471" /LENGTH=361 /DNA_ID=CAMNT_0007505941 /DNA_START=164 /DNA_END=1251 /DNA_ORIENTATION=+
MHALPQRKAPGTPQSRLEPRGRKLSASVSVSARPSTAPQFSDPQSMRRYWRTNGKYRVSPSRLSSVEAHVSMFCCLEPIHYRRVTSPPHTQQEPLTRPCTAADVNLGDVDLGGAVSPPPASPVKLSRPPTAGAIRQRHPVNTLFRRYYQRGDLPISIDHCGGRGNRIKWRVGQLGALDYHVFLPIFVDGTADFCGTRVVVCYAVTQSRVDSHHMNSPAGLRETEDPYRFLAVQGTIELLQAGPSKLIAVIPQIVIPMKAALSTRDPIVVCSVLKTIQFMLNVNPRVGLALAPYYRQILPQLRMFKNAGNRGVDDSIEYDQQQRLNVGDLVTETLEMLQRTGGPEAYHQIKYIIPTYERTEH